MDDRQEQDLNTVNLTESQLQQVQAGRDSIAAQNSQVTITNLLISFFGGRSSPPKIDWNWATQILKQQRSDIKERLKKSLFGLAEVDTIEVESKRQENSPALALEARKTLTVNGTEVGIIDPQEQMIQTYAREDINGKLLILGMPGAGKTIALLKLAEQLVHEAIVNPETVIPIIFELSTWRDGQSIEVWLIEQLYELCGGKREQKIYETWLERRVLLPLLDGLDELGMLRQKACTEKVNEFAKQYPQVVVCCRVNEFQQAGINLSNLRGKVQLQPLSDRQIEFYLQQVDKVGLWQQIMNAPEMALMLEPNEDGEPGLLRVPLFISIAATIYDGKQSFQNKGDLLEKYIERQLSFDVRKGDRSRKEFAGRKWAFRTTDNELHTRSVKKYLKWLSNKLRDAEITDFQVKFLTHDWMRNVNCEDWKLQEKPIIWLDSKTKRACDFLLFLLVPFLGWNIISVYPHFLGDIIIAILSTTISLIVSTTLCGLIGYGIVSVVVYLFSRFSLISKILYLSNGLIQFALKYFRILFYKSNGLISRIRMYEDLFAPILVIIAFISLGLVANQYLIPIYARISVSCLGFITNHLPISCLIGWLGGSIYGIFLGLAVVTFHTFKYRKGIYPNSSTKENETSTDLTYSARWYWDALNVYIHAPYILGVYIFHKSDIEIPTDVSNSTLIPLFPLGIVVVTYVINHMMSDGYLGQLPIRLVLFWQGKTPWKYTRFLNYCAERRLLQRIGGRYRFIHRELLDHFGMKN